jgi:hypothetical protein
LKFTPYPVHKWKPVDKKAYQENQDGPLQQLSPEYGVATLLQAGHYKGHSITHRKQKKGKDKVGGSDTMP